MKNRAASESELHRPATLSRHAPRRLVGKDSTGASFAEYAILVGVIAMLSLGAWRAFGTVFKCKWLEASYALGELDTTDKAALAACHSRAQLESFAAPPAQRSEDGAEDESARAQQLLAGSQAGEPAPAPVSSQVDRSGPLGDPAIQTALRDAWDESHPGRPDSHEMGGWIVKNEGIVRAVRGPYSVELWEVGSNRKVKSRAMPPNAVGAFHTHPNLDPRYVQEPSGADYRVVRDIALGAPNHQEFVISDGQVYRVTATKVESLGTRDQVLGTTPPPSAGCSPRRG